MAKTIKGADLGDLIQKELTEYSRTLTDKVNQLSDKAAKTLVKRTKATAPKRTGDFRRRIAYKRTKQGLTGDTYTWYVKAPDHRITHLLVHGHAKQNGGRVKGDPFLANALADVLPAYEEEIKEAIQDA